MPDFLIKNTASGKYVNRVLAANLAAVTVPAGHTVEAQTTANLAQWGTDATETAAAARARVEFFLRTSQSPEMIALRALALVMLDEINIVRTTPAAVLAARTQGQLLDAVATKITNGAAD